MRKRLLTAVAGIPAIVLIVSNSNTCIFFIFILILTILALREFYSMALSEDSFIGRYIGLVLGCLIPVSVFYESGISHAADAGMMSVGLITSGICAGSIIVIFIYHIISPCEINEWFNRIAVKVFGIFYIALLLSYVILLRLRPSGMELVFFLICVTWAGDTGAYFIGTWKGKRLLCPVISPKKTIEGAAGSLVCGTVIALVFKLIFFVNMSIVHCFILAAGINFMNQFGDLSESLVKRTFGAKDSGTIFPGHGGILDRIDSLLFAAPFLYYYIQIVLPVI